jgi:hypothetical protein
MRVKLYTYASDNADDTFGAVVTDPKTGQVPSAEFKDGADEIVLRWAIDWCCDDKNDYLPNIYRMEVVEINEDGIITKTVTRAQKCGNCELLHFVDEDKANAFEELGLVQKQGAFAKAWCGAIGHEIMQLQPLLDKLGISSAEVSTQCVWIGIALAKIEPEFTDKILRFRMQEWPDDQRETSYNNLISFCAEHVRNGYTVAEKRGIPISDAD